MNLRGPRVKPGVIGAGGFQWRFIAFIESGIGPHTLLSLSNVYFV